MFLIKSFVYRKDVKNFINADLLKVKTSIIKVVKKKINKLICKI